MHKQQGWPQAWEYSQAKLIQHLGELHKEWTEAGVSASRVTTLRRLQERATKPLLNQRQRQKHLTWAVEKKNWTVAQWSKVLFSDESKFCISFGNQGPRVWRKSGEAQNPCCLKSSVKFPQSVIDLGCHVICWCWSTVFSEVHSRRSHLPGNFRALLASFCWQALWRCWFHFPAGLGTCPHCQRYQSWLNDHGVTVLDWSANSPDLNLVKRKMRDTRPNNADDLKAAIKANLVFHTTSAVPQTDHLHATQNWGSSN